MSEPRPDLHAEIMRLTDRLRELEGAQSELEEANELLGDARRQLALFAQRAEHAEQRVAELEQELERRNGA